MSPYNAVVESGYVARDGTFRHYVTMDGRGQVPMPLEYSVALPDRTRVRVVDGAIVDAQVAHV